MAGDAREAGNDAGNDRVGIVSRGAEAGKREGRAGGDAREATNEGMGIVSRGAEAGKRKRREERAGGGVREEGLPLRGEGGPGWYRELYGSADGGTAGASTVEVPPRWYRELYGETSKKRPKGVAKGRRRKCWPLTWRATGLAGWRVVGDARGE